MLSLLLTAIVVAGPAVAPSPSPSRSPTAAPVRVLVLDLEAISVEASVSRSVDPIVLGAVSGIDGVEAVSTAEIKRLAEMEAARAEIGCDTSSCLAELAGAMGARFVLFGGVSRLGTTTTVALSLFDSASTAIARDTVAVSDLGLLPTELPPRVRALVARAAGLDLEAAKLAGAPPTGATTAAPAELPSLLFVAGLGGAIVGGAALVGGGIYAAVNEATIQDPTALADTKTDAQQSGVAGVIAAGAGLALAAVGATLLVLDGGT